MDEDILLFLQSASAGFSKGKKKIAAYILENCESAAFMTAEALGRATGVSESTVVRFATELGLCGYPELQKALQEKIRKNLHADVYGDISAGKGTFSVALQSDIERLRKTARMLQEDSLEKAVDTLLRSSGIYILGIGTAALLAQFLGQSLQRIFDFVLVVTETDMQGSLEKLINIRAGDALVVFFGPQQPPETEKCIRYCLSTGANVICITDRVQPEFVDKGALVLKVAWDTGSVVENMTVPMCIAGTLAETLAEKRRTFVQERKTAINQLLKEYDTNRNGENRYEL